MNAFKFKTNINCNGCVEKVTPSLNGAEGIEKWEVDINNPQKILTIQTSSLNEREIIAIVKNAGYHVEKLID